jgi:hypothetical protein
MSDFRAAAASSEQAIVGLFSNPARLKNPDVPEQD